MLTSRSRSRVAQFKLFHPPHRSPSSQGLPQEIKRKTVRLPRSCSMTMQERLEHLGWREIEVVDEDLGRSAAGTVPRAGFERVVAEVCLGKVGAVAAREVSRFARNGREWQQLVEVCRVVDTVLIDQDTVIHPGKVTTDCCWG